MKQPTKELGGILNFKFLLSKELRRILNYKFLL